MFLQNQYDQTIRTPTQVKNFYKDFYKQLQCQDRLLKYTYKHKFSQAFLLLLFGGKNSIFNRVSKLILHAFHFKSSYFIATVVIPNTGFFFRKEAATFLKQDFKKSLKRKGQRPFNRLMDHGTGGISSHSISFFSKKIRFSIIRKFK